LLVRSVSIDIDDDFAKQSAAQAPCSAIYSAPQRFDRIELAARIAG
jgi:hypothetical protein